LSKVSVLPGPDFKASLTLAAGRTVSRVDIDADGVLEVAVSDDVDWRPSVRFFDRLSWVATVEPPDGSAVCSPPPPPGSSCGPWWCSRSCSASP
jgi:hypothetical protein